MPSTVAPALLVSQDVVDVVGSTKVVFTPIGSVTVRGVSRIEQVGHTAPLLVRIALTLAHRP